MRKQPAAPFRRAFCSTGLAFQVHFVARLYLVTLIFVSGHAGAQPLHDDAFECAGTFPASAQAIIAIVRWPEVSQIIQQSPIGQGWSACWQDAGVRKAVESIASKAGIDGTEAWQTLVGEAVVFVKMRPTTQPVSLEAMVSTDQSAGWVVCCRVNEGVFQQWLRGGGGRVAEWVGDTAIFNLQKTGAELSFRDGWMFLSDPGDRTQLKDLLTAADKGGLLSDSKEFKEARLLGRGQFALFMRSIGPDNWMAMSGEVDQEGFRGQVMMRHADLSVGEHIAPCAPADVGCLEWLKCNSPALAGFEILSLSVDRLPSGAEFEGQMRDPALAPVMATPMGAILETATELARQVGPTSISIAASPITATEPAGPGLSWAVELRPEGADSALALLDGIMGSAARAASVAAGLAGGVRIEVPTDWPQNREAVRKVDLSAVSGVIDWTKAGFVAPDDLPIFHDLCLVWSEIRGDDDRRWWAVSTSERQHLALSEALKQLNGRRSEGNLISKGVIGGAAVSRMMDTWPGLAGMETNGRVARIRGFREMVRPLNVVWEVRRTSPQSEEGVVTIRWIPPDRTDPDPSVHGLDP